MSFDFTKFPGLNKQTLKSEIENLNSFEDNDSSIIEAKYEPQPEENPIRLKNVIDDSWQELSSIVSSSLKCFTEKNIRDCNKLKSKVSEFKQLKKASKGRRPLMKAMIKRFILQALQSKGIRDNLKNIEGVFSKNSFNENINMKTMPGPDKLNEMSGPKKSNKNFNNNFSEFVSK